MAKILFFFLLLANTVVFGQQRFTLKGAVKDSITHESLNFVNVIVSEQGEGKVINTKTTDNEGLFELKNLPYGTFILTLSSMGYNNVQRTVNLEGKPVIDLGEIYMTESSYRLSDVVVEAIGNPIVFKKDTIEYNASSYKVTENAVLEDLIKKLPGAEVDTDGKITVNGKEISRVMIDGQTFFANDPQIASKNLPAKMVDKVQVVERKSDQAQFTGIDDGNEETVLNLTVKPGMKNGWLGNFSGGAGYEDRYQGGGFVARFDNNWQLSLIGSGNNTNNRGFTDIAGSMMQSGRGGGGGGGMMASGGSGGRQGGFNLNVGGTRMNIGGNGITTSWLGGLNGNIQLNPNLKIAGNYFYSGSDNVIMQESTRENILPDNANNFFYVQDNRSSNITEGHRASVELEYTIDPFNSIIFKPNTSMSYGNFDELNDYHSVLVSGDSISKGWSISRGENAYISTDGDLLFRHKFRTDGRTFSINLNYGYNNNATDGTNQSETYAFEENKKEDINQQYNTENKGYNVGTRLSYTEPIGNNYYIELAYNLRYNKNSSDKTTYDYNALSGKYDRLDTDFSSQYNNIFINQTAEINFRSIREKYNYTLGINAQPAYMRSENIRSGSYTDFSRNVVNFAPNANFIYNYSEYEQLRINYRGNTSQPSISQLQPVPDNSNPMLVNLGNPDLDPEFSHNLMMMYRNTNITTFRTLFVIFNANYAQDRIVNQSIYDSTGRQIITPVNTDGVYNAMGRIMINTPINKSKFFIMSNSGLNFNQAISFSGNDFNNIVRNRTQNLNINEMLRFNYRGDQLDVGIGGRANFTKAWYSTGNQESTDYWNNAVTADFNWTLPWDLTLASDANYNFYVGYSSGYNEPMCIWNAELAKQLFKQKQATLAIRVYDLLNESRGTSRTTTDNYIEDVTTNTLGRYIMLSFTYRFGSFGGQRNSGERPRGRMMMGPPPPGMGR